MSTGAFDRRDGRAVRAGFVETIDRTDSSVWATVGLVGRPNEVHGLNGILYSDERNNMGPRMSVAYQLPGKAGVPF